MKRMSTVLITIALLLTISVPAFGAGLDDAFRTGTVATEQFYAAITKPTQNESTFKKVYVVSGQAKQDGLSVMLLIKNGNSYERFKNIDDESSWDIGSSGCFFRAVNLRDGENDLRIVVFKKNDAQNPNAVRQISDFKITLLKENIKNSFLNSIFRVAEVFNGLFSK